jgi:hypothetical protein
MEVDYTFVRVLSIELYRSDLITYWRVCQCQFGLIAYSSLFMHITF